MNLLRKILERDIESLVAGLFLGVITLIIFSEVVTRFLLNYTPPGTEEIATFCFIWFVLFGSVTATKKYSHVKIEILVSRFGPRKRLLLTIIVDALVIFFSVYLALYGYTYMQLEMLSRSAILEIPEGFFILPIPLCAVLMVIYRTVSLVGHVKEYVRPKKEHL